jgi:hypothetical protein
MYCVTYFDYDFKERLVLSYHTNRFSALDKIEELATDFITPLETTGKSHFYSKKSEPVNGYYIEKQLTNPYEIKIKKKDPGYFSNSTRKICSLSVIKNNRKIRTTFDKGYFYNRIGEMKWIKDKNEEPLEIILPETYMILLIELLYGRIAIKEKIEEFDKISKVCIFIDESLENEVLIFEEDL